MMNKDKKASPTNPTEIKQQQVQGAVPAKKSVRQRVGGTAIPGAKSTLPKESSGSNDPNQVQAENYNRDMRRRMQKMQSGPYSERKTATPQEQRKKRIERQKQKIEEQRAKFRRSGPTNLGLGRQTFYFIVVVAILLIVLIGAFVIWRYFL